MQFGLYQHQFVLYVDRARWKIYRSTNQRKGNLKMRFKGKEHIFEDEASRVRQNKNLQWPAKFDTYKLAKNRCYVFSI